MAGLMFSSCARAVARVTLVVLLLAGVTRAQDSFLKDAAAAKAFCASPAFKTAKCGLATAAESDTYKNQCLLCGSAYRYLPRDLPREVEGEEQGRYPYAIAAVSLACKGPIVVRSVFKMLQDQPFFKSDSMDGTDCTNSRLRYMDNEESRSASPVIRCELELPNTGGSEAERALKAKETNCYKCWTCSEGGCPSAKGKWYSDSYTTVAKGCDFDAKNGYSAHRVGFGIGGDTKILLAKFEVCNNPGCFDPAYEQAKLRTAKNCVKAKCDA